MQPLSLQPDKLTPMQIDLLGLFARNIPDEQLMDIRRLLVRYFAQKASEEMDRILEEKGMDANEWAEQIMSEHLRTPYKPKDGTLYQEK